jgi:tetratricopeptide (TPR) repeat protein
MMKDSPINPASNLISRLAPCILILAIALAYHNTLAVPYLFDDVPAIAENPTIASVWRSLIPPAGSGSTVSGRPLLNFSFAISQSLGGGSLAVHHLVNIAIHGANACLLFALLLRTLQLPSLSKTAQRSPHLVALATALLWSLHPLQTESVTYLIQRAESLVAFFYLLTLYLFVRAKTASPARSTILFAATVAACAFGMASKEVMASAPLLVLLYDRAFLSRDLSTAWKTHCHFYTALFTTWIILILCIAQSGFRGNTTGFNAGTPWFDYLATQAWALTHYLRLVLWPSPLVFDYGRELVTSFGQIAWRATLLLLVIVWVFKSWWQNRPSAFLGVLALAVLAPTTLVPVATQTIAEHRTYLALAPLFAGVAVLLFRFLSPKTALTLTGMLSLALAFATIDRNRDYRSIESLWADTLAKRPQNDRAWYSLGYIHLDKNLPVQAREYFREAMRLRSDPINIMGYAHALTQAGETEEALSLYRQSIALVPRTHGEIYESMANVGLLLGKKGLHDEAVRWLIDAIAINPRKAGAYYNLGAIYVTLGRYSEAVPNLRQAVSDQKQGDEATSLLVRSLLSLGQKKEALALAEKQKSARPTSLTVRLAYAQSLAATGKTDAALSEYQAVLAQNPSFPSARTQLGILYFATRRLDDARHHLELAVDQNPADHIALSTLAEVLLKSGALDEAVPRFEAALRLAPADHKSRYQLANSLLQLGRFDNAIIHYQILVRDRSAPLAEIHNELAIAYAQKGDFANARVHFTECLRIKPTHNGAAENLRRLPAP